MKKIIILNKKEGETPLEALERFRARNKKYKDVKMTYAGRLDPMASGVLLVLAGEKVKEKEKYLALNKEYEFQILFGFATDTYDILGKVVATFPRVHLGKLGQRLLEQKIKENIKYFTGELSQTYPLYSSKTVKGKPLFAYGREGTEVSRPEREVVVKKLKFLNVRKISSARLLANLERRIAKVNGDFRQKEILKIWRRKLKVFGQTYYFPVVKFAITCGSGTYVRGIADALGERLAIPSLAYSIKRTKIGKWRVGR